MRTWIAFAALMCVAAVPAVAIPQPFAVAVLQESPNGNQLAAFDACAAIGTSNDVIEFISGGGGQTLHLPGQLHVGDIVCSRGMSSDLTLWNWRQDAIDHNNTAFKNGKLKLLDTSFNTIVTWTFAHGWLSKIYYGGDKFTETIVLTTDQLSRNGEPLVPVITWTPAPLTYGQLLGTDQLNATADAPGSFTYDPPAGTLLPAGTQTLHATFHPDDPTQFQQVTVSADVTVNKALLTATADDKTKTYGSPNPTLTFTLTGFVNGENASVVTGAPVLTTTATTTSDVGQYPITIALGTLSAANYDFQLANGTLTITKADQTINWATPDPIVFGTALSSTQLNATVTVIGPAPAGALTYAPPAGTILNAGNQVLTATAAETNDYNSATATVHLTVLKATPVFSDLSSPIIAKGTPSTTLSGKITAPPGEDVAITLISTTQPATIQPDGTFSSAFATGALAVSATPYPITYAYAGDNNFNPITGSGTLTVAYLDALTGTVKTPAVDNDHGNRPFNARFSGPMTGSIPSDFKAFVNYTPAVPGPNVTFTVTDGTWTLHADNKKPLPKGNISGLITGGTVVWDANGTKATVTLQMTIDSGTGDFKGITGTAQFIGGAWDFTAQTINGQLLLFY